MYARGREEFSRVLAFSDGLFAIAMTLLVVGIQVPDLPDGASVSELAGAINDRSASLISFFISFAVIGRYWVAHHAFFGMLRGVDRTIVGTNLVYLAFIALMPFPTALLGTFFENPLSVAVYAATVAAVSGMEVVQLLVAYRHGLLERDMPRDVYRWELAMSFSPVVIFLISIPIAFASTTVAVAVWFIGIPLQAVANRWKPERADEFPLV